MGDTSTGVGSTTIHIQRTARAGRDKGVLRNPRTTSVTSGCKHTPCWGGRIGGEEGSTGLPGGGFGGIFVPDFLRPLGKRSTMKLPVSATLVVGAALVLFAGRPAAAQNPSPAQAQQLLQQAQQNPALAEQLRQRLEQSGLT